MSLAALTWPQSLILLLIVAAVLLFISYVVTGYGDLDD